MWNCSLAVGNITAFRVCYCVTVLHDTTSCLNKNTCVYNFDKCWSIFNFFSLLYSPWNLQQNPCHTSCHTLKVLLHYLAKHRRPKLAKFCCTQRNDFCLMFTELTDMIGRNKICIIWSWIKCENFILLHECPYRDVCATYHLHRWRHRWGNAAAGLPSHDVDELKWSRAWLMSGMVLSKVSSMCESMKLWAFNLTPYNA